MRKLLHDGWTLRAVGGPAPAEIAEAVVPATVPGCVHTDLLAADLIPDPYLDDNESALAWIGRTDWRYETTFEWDETEDYDFVELVCAGLDTIARVELNGTVVGETRNMHRTHRLDVSDVLRTGNNVLTVTFSAAVEHIERLRAENGELPHTNHHPYNLIRKMACNFGWDWGPDVVTAGIWRPIAVEGISHARLAEVRPLVEVRDGIGRVTTHIELARGGEQSEPLLVSVEVAGNQVEFAVDADEDDAVVGIGVEDPELWWPHGHGAQPLYPIAVRLRSVESGAELDVWESEIGFRTVVLDTGSDVEGTRFTFVINGKPVFVRGANWIPDDAFPHRVDATRYAARITQAKDAGVNLLRVWGGGIFESDDFYRICDREGMLTWQDFLFACAAYPEEEPLRGEVIAEAREAVARLSPHPSLVLWNGNNENNWGWHDWGWQERLGDRTWGWGYYTELLPEIVAELDPTRPYTASSPWSVTSEIHPNDPAHGSMHVWDVWNSRDYLAYRDYRPRFVAEFGYQGPPTSTTLRRAVHDEPLTPTSPGMAVHQKAADGDAKLTRGLDAHFGVPADFDDWCWATQLNQARAVSLGIDHFRALHPVCAGTVVWQLNDCWPVTSWAAIDGDGRKKPLWYALRRSYLDRLLTVQPRDGGLAVVAVNDTDQEWSTVLGSRRLSFDGTELIASVEPVVVPPRGSATVVLAEDLATPGSAGSELVVVDADTGQRAWWFYRPDKDLELPAAALRVEVEDVEGGHRVHVHAAALVRDVAILADRVAPDAEVDDMLVTLLPGESRTFLVRGTGQADPRRFAAPDVLRTANQLVAR
ncbi:glycoside hydrolase family 2 protein [Actinoalloteichus hymeniacidonis]|uniref:beta-mannosidase n=1 Tax=Actinoalloteichus hymeniacidonis TaxID=340345 RepID=A0AAC9MY71_9PSEU|nr:glycoside hydrolase family 2 protein [Actinoalloteichus hymeniacidonis]AOS62581.1 beta-mannosidase [Actinoalloteichus hymeniacidonis]MBB5909388.1 beta-mannosidase [Actinoalloteichus hymeniacidonis]